MAVSKPIPFPHKQYGMYPVEEDLRDAAYRGDINRIKELKKQHPKLDLNAVNEYGETSLYIACKRNQNDTVNYMLDQAGLNLDTPTILGNRCLLIAAWNDNNDIAKKLVDKGADIHARTNPDRQFHGNVSALDIATERGNKELVDFLKPLVEQNTPTINHRI